MEGSKRITKVFGSMRFDYNAKRNSIRCEGTAESLEDICEPEPRVRYARVKQVAKSKLRGRS